MDPFTITILGSLFGGVGVAILVALARRYPKVMKALKRSFLGTDFLVLGPEQTGKSSFYNFLRYDQYADSVPASKTVVVSDKFSFTTEKGGELKLDVSSAFDVPGELPPRSQAEIAANKSPNTLIIFLSGDNQENEKWLTEFCEELYVQLANNRHFSKKLTTFSIVINKMDLLAENQLTDLTANLTKITREKLGPILGKNVNRITIQACTLFRSKDGEKIANEVLLSIITSVKKKQKLVDN